jgi:hypothetical protein
MSRLCLAATIAAALAGITVPSIAMAQTAPPSYDEPDAPIEPTYLTLEHFEAYIERGQLVIEYQLARPSWRMLRSARVTPTLNWRDHSQSVHMAIDLRRSSDRLTFPLDRRRADFDELEVWIAGDTQRFVFGGFDVGGVTLRRLVVPVDGWERRGPRPGEPTTPDTVPVTAPRPAWAAHPEVIKACGAGFDGDANESACLELAARAVIDPRPALAACDQLMDGDPNELLCLGIALSASVDRTAALRRCDAGYDGDDAELGCFRTVIHTAWDPSAAIDACDAAGNGDASEQACLAVAVRATVDPSAAIQTCHQAMSGDDALLSCMRHAIR